MNYRKLAIAQILMFIISVLLTFVYYFMYMISWETLCLGGCGRSVITDTFRILTTPMNMLANYGYNLFYVGGDASVADAYDKGTLFAIVISFIIIFAMLNLAYFLYKKRKIKSDGEKNL